MFEVWIQAKKLKHVVNVLHEVDDEVVFLANPKGMTAKIVDPLQAIIAKVVMPAEAFVSYDVSKKYEFGVDLDKLDQIINQVPDEEMVVIETPDYKKDKWALTWGIHQHQMGLVKPKQIKKAPTKFKFSLNHTADIKISGQDIKAIHKASENCNHITVDADCDEVVFSSFDEDSKIDQYHTTPLPCKTVGASKCMYSIEYLSYVLYGVMLGDRVCFRFGSDIPCEIGYNRDGVTVHHILAPRIESD